MVKKNGNIEIYSLNKSFSEQILWKFTIYFKDENDIITGIVEKVKKNKNLPFCDGEAEKALNANFVGAQKISLENKSPDEFTLFQGKNVAFTLTVVSQKENQLEQYQKKKGSEDSLKVEKIKIVLKETPSFGKIRGLLITEEILPLQECVEILASWFPLNTITWLTYCTNPEAWLSSK